MLQRTMTVSGPTDKTADNDEKTILGPSCAAVLRMTADRQGPRWTLSLELKQARILENAAV